ncbi:MAG: SDR family NAD(P)-dependent oxidoreductase, partial [Candidatus Dadabacteria bacterium]
MFTEDTLKDRVVLITGGGSGLGLAMAKAAAACGARLLLCGRSNERLKNAENELALPAERIFTYSVDVRDYEGVATMVKEGIDYFGRIDALINNAAGNFYCLSEELSPGGFKTIVDIVLNGTFNCTQHFGRHAIARGGGGVVLNIVTTYTETGSSFVLPSACAKAGVYALTTSLAYEWGIYGIRLNSIAPGPFPTEGAWKRLVPDKRLEEILRQQNPLQRFG